MDFELFAESIEYERLTQAVYQAIMRREGQNIKVQHDAKLPGKSGVLHQVDVLWSFRVAGVDQVVLIECKNYASALTLEKVRNFFAVLHDVGNCRGLMVTRTGYQSGVEQFAGFYGIGLKLLRRPELEDWQGKIKDIKVNLHVRSVVSNDHQPLKVFIHFLPRDTQQEARLNALSVAGRLAVADPPKTVFWDQSRTTMTEELRWWLPKQIKIADTANGGPYMQTIPLVDRYLLVNEGEADEEFVKVDHLDVEYFVQTVDNREIVLRGEDIVEAILKDFGTGEVEYVKHKNS